MCICSYSCIECLIATWQPVVASSGMTCRQGSVERNNVLESTAVYSKNTDHEQGSCRVLWQSVEININKLKIMYMYMWNEFFIQLQSTNTNWTIRYVKSSLIKGQYWALIHLFHNWKTCARVCTYFLNLCKACQVDVGYLPEVSCFGQSQHCMQPLPDLKRYEQNEVTVLLNNRQQLCASLTIARIQYRYHSTLSAKFGRRNRSLWWLQKELEQLSQPYHILLPVQ